MNEEALAKVLHMIPDVARAAINIPGAPDWTINRLMKIIVELIKQTNDKITSLEGDSEKADSFLAIISHIHQPSAASARLALEQSNAWNSQLSLYDVSAQSYWDSADWIQQVLWATMRRISEDELPLATVLQRTQRVLLDNGKAPGKIVIDGREIGLRRGAAPMSEYHVRVIGFIAEQVQAAKLLANLADSLFVTVDEEQHLYKFDRGYVEIAELMGLRKKDAPAIIRKVFSDLSDREIKIEGISARPWTLYNVENARLRELGGVGAELDKFRPSDTLLIRPNDVLTGRIWDTLGHKPKHKDLRKSAPWPQFPSGHVPPTIRGTFSALVHIACDMLVDSATVTLADLERRAAQSGYPNAGRVLTAHTVDSTPIRINGGVVAPSELIAGYIRERARERTKGSQAGKKSVAKRRKAWGAP